MSDIVKTEIIDNVALLTLNDPDRLNALSLDMIAELHKNIILINNGEIKARCLVITGAGGVFAQGQI